MRDIATRAGYCAGVALLVFVGLAAAFTGNALAALIEFALAGAWSGYALRQVRHGRM